jgi:hypothetical protein
MTPFIERRIITILIPTVLVLFALVTARLGVEFYQNRERVGPLVTGDGIVVRFHGPVNLMPTGMRKGRPVHRYHTPGGILEVVYLPYPTDANTP